MYNSRPALSNRVFDSSACRIDRSQIYLLQDYFNLSKFDLLTISKDECQINEEEYQYLFDGCDWHFQGHFDRIVAHFFDSQIPQFEGITEHLQLTLGL